MFENKFGWAIMHWIQPIEIQPTSGYLLRNLYWKDAGCRIPCISNGDQQNKKAKLKIGKAE